MNFHFSRENTSLSCRAWYSRFKQIDRMCITSQGLQVRKSFPGLNRQPMSLNSKVI